MDNNSSSSSWDLEMSNMGINHFPLELIRPSDPPFFLGSAPSSSLLPPAPASSFIPRDPIMADLGEEEEGTEAAAAAGEEEEEEETLGAMKEMMYRIAAMQPVDIDPATIKKPRRRNVRISDDPQSVAARHRRERISERIRILQRLVPGGTKMDTASMLDEAIRYVKFLKRQVQELQHSPSPPPPPPIQSPAVAWAAAPPRPPPRPDATAAASSSSSSSAMGAPRGLGFGF